MKKNLLLYSLMTMFLIFFININQVYAISLSPGKVSQNVEPGDQVEITINIGNDEKTIQNLQIQKADVLKSKVTEGWDYFVEGESDKTAYSMRDWITISPDFNNKISIDPEKQLQIPITINVPKDATPGLHLGAVLATAVPGGDSAGIKYGFKIVSIIQLTVNGDVNENIELSEFTLDEMKYKQGDIAFKIKLKNDGNTLIAPKGKIEIFNKNTGEQVKNILNIIEKHEGIEKIVGSSDYIEVNYPPITPSEEANYDVLWDDRTISTGDYKAKLSLFYGINQDKELKSELDFKISENLIISEFQPSALLSMGLPVSFEAKIKNNGTKTLEPRGTFSIKNIIGAEKYTKELDPKELIILGGNELKINNLKWEDGLAVGYYNAVLKLTYGETNQSISKTIGFWVLNLWQIIVGLILFVAVVFVIYKLIKGYFRMKKKLEKMESKK